MVNDTCLQVQRKRRIARLFQYNGKLIDHHIVAAAAVEYLAMVIPCSVNGTSDMPLPYEFSLILDYAVATHQPLAG